jgi:sugar phosphate isomerase/epimerase
MRTQKSISSRRRAIAGIVLALVFDCISAGARELPNPFFAMDTGTQDATHKTPAEQVALVKEIGFAGVGPTYHNRVELQEWLAALDQSRLKMYALYLPLQLDDVPASLSSIKEAAAMLRGRETLLWVYINDKRGADFDSKDDATAVQAFRTISDYAKDAGLRVAIYPHAGFSVQTVEDAVRLAAEVHRDNVGVTFNLCHWLMVDGNDLAATLKVAQAYLYCVTINGADIGGKSWDKLIQPLDRGTFDVSQVLRLLRSMEYTGPIGLQQYGIGGDAEVNLKHSMAGWRKLSGNR